MPLPIAYELPNEYLMNPGYKGPVLAIGLRCGWTVFFHMSMAEWMGLTEEGRQKRIDSEEKALGSSRLKHGNPLCEDCGRCRHDALEGVPPRTPPTPACICQKS